MDTTRRIVSLWLPDFATDRLTRRTGTHAIRRDRPLATLIQHHSALALAAVNGAARDSGLHPGQVLADARSLCPEIATVPADPAGEMAALAALARWCGRWSPWSTIGSLGADGSGGTSGSTPPAAPTCSAANRLCSTT